MSSPYSATRVVILGAGIAGAIALHSGVAFAAIILLAVRYSAPEAVLLGLLFDLLSTPGPFSAHLPLGTIIAVVALVAMEPVRKELIGAMR